MPFSLAVTRPFLKVFLTHDEVFPVLLYPYKFPRIRLKDAIFWALFLRRSDVPIGPSLSFVLQGSAEIFFRRTFTIDRPILTLDRLFDD